MRKRKNGERRYWDWVKRGLLILIIGLIFILSTPTLYAFLTYYHVPDTEQSEYSRWIERTQKQYEICIGAWVGGFPFLPHVLQYKFVINDEVIPLSEVHVFDRKDYYDAFSSYPDSVCTTQPTLEIGRHELILFTYHGGYNFGWIKYRSSIFYVDEEGNVSNEVN